LCKICSGNQVNSAVAVARCGKIRIFAGCDKNNPIM
jgi:hypothetical protein